MKKLLTLYFLLAFMTPAYAALSPGDHAPDFTAQASLDGEEFTFALADALKQGPVVLYFYPAAFTKGCTVEAHDFADAADNFAALGATIIGVSHDKIETLDKFSVAECRSKFAVAADTDGKIMKDYDAVLVSSLLGMANRTSYVISPDGEILYAYTALAPDEHVANTLKAVREWRAKNPQSAK